MKKFLSLLCAVAIVLGASAAPVAKKAGVVKFQRAAVEKLRTEKKSLAKKSVKKDAFAQKKQAELQKNARLAAGEAKIATASLKRAKAEAIDVSTCMARTTQSRSTLISSTAVRLLICNWARSTRLRISM